MESDSSVSLGGASLSVRADVSVDSVGKSNGDTTEDWLSSVSLAGIRTQSRVTLVGHSTFFVSLLARHVAYRMIGEHCVGLRGSCLDEEAKISSPVPCFNSKRLAEKLFKMDHSKDKQNGVVGPTILSSVPEGESVEATDSVQSDSETPLIAQSAAPGAEAVTPPRRDRIAEVMQAARRFFFHTRSPSVNDVRSWEWVYEDTYDPLEDAKMPAELTEISARAAHLRLWSVVSNTMVPIYSFHLIALLLMVLQSGSTGFWFSILGLVVMSCGSKILSMSQISKVARSTQEVLVRLDKAWNRNTTSLLAIQNKYRKKKNSGRHGAGSRNAASGAAAGSVSKSSSAGILAILWNERDPQKALQELELEILFSVDPSTGAYMYNIATLLTTDAAGTTTTADASARTSTIISGSERTVHNSVPQSIDTSTRDDDGTMQSPSTDLAETAPLIDVVGDFSPAGPAVAPKRVGYLKTIVATATNRDITSEQLSHKILESDIQMLGGSTDTLTSGLGTGGNHSSSMIMLNAGSDAAYVDTASNVDLETRGSNSVISSTLTLSVGTPSTVALFREVRTLSIVSAVARSQQLGEPAEARTEAKSATPSTSSLVAAAKNGSKRGSASGLVSAASGGGSTTAADANSKEAGAANTHPLPHPHPTDPQLARPSVASMIHAKRDSPAGSGPSPMAPPSRRDSILRRFSFGGVGKSHRNSEAGHRKMSTVSFVATPNAPGPGSGAGAGANGASGAGGAAPSNASPTAPAGPLSLVVPLIRRRQTIRRARCVALLQLEIQRRNLRTILYSESISRTSCAILTFLCYIIIHWVFLQHPSPTLEDETAQYSGRLFAVGTRVLVLLCWELIVAFLLNGLTAWRAHLDFHFVYHRERRYRWYHHESHLIFSVLTAVSNVALFCASFNFDLYGSILF
jgi:hypothetical protein